ncbi:cell wall-binding repeat-containing protein [Leifsonia lichenia]
MPGATQQGHAEFYDGPGGQPWWLESGVLKTVAHGALVTHQLPSGTDWTRESVTTGPDQSLWLESTQLSTVVRVGPDGSFAVIPVSGARPTSGIKVAVDGAAWMTYPSSTGWAAVRIAPDGTQKSFPESGDWPDFEQYQGGYANAGPDGSVWGTALYNKPVGIYPDGHVVRPNAVALWQFQAAGAEYLVDLQNNINRVNPDGSTTAVASGVTDITQSGDQAFYTTPVDSAHRKLHRLGTPGWQPVIPMTGALPSQILWVPAAHSLWLPLYDQKAGIDVEYAIGEDGRTTRIAGSSGFSLGPDGSVWSNDGSWHLNADGSVISERSLVWETYAQRSALWGGVSADGPWMVYLTSGAHSMIALRSPAAVTRLAGDDRYETAVAVAKRAYPTHAAVVYLAAGGNFPDALAAGPAAAADRAALLLTTSSGIPAATATELKALAPGRVVIVGGTSSIGSAVESSVRRLLPSATVQRRSGANRYETANQVVGSVFHSASTVYVASGATFPDALGAGAAAGSAGDPLLLVDPSSPGVAASTAAAITRLHPARIVVVGGPSAVPDAVVAALGRLAPTSRVAGADRFATSVALAKAAFPGAKAAFFASGDNFPDAMSGAVLAATTHAPVYAMTSGCVPAPLDAQFGSGSVTSFTLVGGIAVLSDALDTLHSCS